MNRKPDEEIVRTTHNTARFFVEQKHIAWVLLIATCLWGVYGYFSMPQRKDPEVAVRVAVAITPWPGAAAEKVEQLVTRQVEERMAENAKVTKIESISRTGVSVVYVHLDEKVKEPGKEFDDINLKLDSIRNLPQGAGPISFLKDFGDTSALMLTVASPPVGEEEIELRARTILKEVEPVRKRLDGPDPRLTIVYCHPPSVDARMIRRPFSAFIEFAKQRGMLAGGEIVQGDGFIAYDAPAKWNDADLQALGREFISTRLQSSEFHPDVWQPVIVHDLSEMKSKLASVAGDKYSYREMDDITDMIEKTLKTIPQVSKISRSGVLSEKVYLLYSQERLASYGVQPATLPSILGARNITLPGGVLNAQGKNLSIDPSGEFKSEAEIGDVLINMPGSSPVYLRDLVEMMRGYDSPPRFLNFYNWRDEHGHWRRSRAITLAVQMRSGEQIAVFGAAIDAALADLKTRIPQDLILARTSDQPVQVEESIDLFMKSLYEAIVLVVLVSLIGFWEWRSAVLMALSIPLTLAMTFGMMHALGVDLQQVSIATLIIALGLLVDDPVVAGDAIKRELAAGQDRGTAAWLGPTKLATAILFATITNIVAYLPFLTLSGAVGEFLHTLPVVMTCSLVASRLVSMTFIPMLGKWLLRPVSDLPIEERRKHGFAALYYRVGAAAIRHRGRVLAASLAVPLLGVLLATQLQQQFFPKDLSYLSYVDVWLPEDAPLTSTDETAKRVEAVIRSTAEQYGKEQPHPHEVLASLTTFVGGGGPRFWYSVNPELQQLNYAQILIQVKDKHDTAPLVAKLQEAVSAAVPGAIVDVRQTETGKPVGIPVSVRISGEDIAALRSVAEQVKGVFRAIPEATRVRDDWGEESFSVELKTDPDRANLAGISNLDVAAASAAAMNGFPVTTLREGEKQIPVVVLLRMEERSRLADVKNLYVYSLQGMQKVPISQVSSIQYQMKTEKLRRRNQFRTITVSCFPVGGKLPFQVMNQAEAGLEKIRLSLPPGYRMEIGGEKEEQDKGFRELAVVLAISVTAIFLALVFQFRHAVKPVIVFAAIPYGMTGALVALWLMRMPFGFMAFLGVVSLVGVIVSHIIVLFDFIEEAHERGASLQEALLDAGILRLRPVLITVGATVFALFPLALHGGPLWEPLCYAQIGGLCIATVITLILVPVIYSIFVLDLKLVKWGGENRGDAEARSSERME